MPWSIACFAPSRTGRGTSVSQTPWARLIPCTFSQAIDMARISDCTVRAARRLRDRGMGTPRDSNDCKSQALQMTSIRELHQRRSGIHQNDIATRRFLALKQLPDDVGVGLKIAAQNCTHRSAIQPKLLR